MTLVMTSTDTNNSNREYTNIRISKSTKSKLNDLAKKGEPYESVVLRLLEVWNH